jgi:two-component system sensor histidine kinase/response regulator
MEKTIKKEKRGDIMTGKNKEKQNKPLILIAEDIPKNMEMVCSILRKEGYRLAMAGNGRQALTMVPDVRPDLILLDIMMPEMNGFEVCEELKKKTGTKDIPIIFLTAKVDTEDVVKGFELGAVDYVTKPFKGAELLSRVKTHLELKFAREELKELNATKDKFLSIIAHDLRNPLQCLLLYADSLHNDYTLINEEQRKDYFYKFFNNSNLIAALLENLLKWAQSQRGILEQHPEKIDLHALTTENIELLKENAVKKDISVSSTVQPGTFAYADKNMIRTVIRNLLSNAVKFTKPGGKVEVSTAKPANGKTVALTVSDNGVGIKAKEIDGLFRIDVKQQQKTGTANEKGTGMGLILCKEFVEKNNGTIQVTSEPGKGSRFTFTLPGTHKK